MCIDKDLISPIRSPLGNTEDKAMDENEHQAPFALPSSEFDAQTENRMRGYLAELLRRGREREEQEVQEAA